MQTCPDQENVLLIPAIRNFDCSHCGNRKSEIQKMTKVIPSDNHHQEEPKAS